MVILYDFLWNLLYGDSVRNQQKLASVIYFVYIFNSKYDSKIQIAMAISKNVENKGYV